MFSRYITVFLLFFILVTTSSGADNALQFDGTDDLVSIPSSSNYNFGTGDFTIEMWINRANDANMFDVLFAYNTAGDSGSIIISNFLVAGSIFFSKDGTAVIQSSNLSWNMNQWYHIAVTRNSGLMKIYRDTIEVASNTYTGNVGITSGLYFGYGKDRKRNP